MGTTSAAELAVKGGASSFLGFERFSFCGAFVAISWLVDLPSLSTVAA